MIFYLFYFNIQQTSAVINNDCVSLYPLLLSDSRERASESHAAETESERTKSFARRRLRHRVRLTQKVRGWALGRRE